MPDVEAMHLACDALVQRQRVQGRTDPSLLEQLAAADVSSSGAPGGNAGPRSRPPIDVNVVGLLTEIGSVSRRQLTDLGRQQRARRLDLAGLVRAATTATAATDDTTEVAAWLYVLHRWHNSVRAALGLDTDRRQWLRGVRCPTCQGITHGAEIRTPVLAVCWQPVEQASDLDAEVWRWAGIECRACGAWWDRSTMHALISALVTAR